MEYVYETFRTYHGVIALLPEHQARLQRSCGVLGVEAPNLEEIVELGEGEMKIKVSVFADGHYELQTWDIPEWHDSFLYEEVWKVKQVQGAREHAEVKHGDTSFQKLERERAKEEGYDEILMVDEDGHVREGGITNVFFVAGDKLITPFEGILPGIGRDTVLRAADALGIEYELREVHESELTGFDAMFMTNSVRGVVSTGEVLPVMQRVIDWCTTFIQSRIDEGN